jgi:hypothetical protein
MERTILWIDVDEEYETCSSDMSRLPRADPTQRKPCARYMEPPSPCTVRKRAEQAKTCPAG